MNGIVLKKGDTLPVLMAIFQDSNGNAVDLNGATVTFTMKSGSTIKINAAACTVTSASSGMVEYAWTSGDTDTAGTYQGEFEVTNTSGTFTVPTTGYITVEIQDTL